jgi:hypothetical protein
LNAAHSGEILFIKIELINILSHYLLINSNIDLILKMSEGGHECGMLNTRMSTLQSDTSAIHKEKQMLITNITSLEIMSEDKISKKKEIVKNKKEELLKLQKDDSDNLQNGINNDDYENKEKILRKDILECYEELIKTKKNKENKKNLTEQLNIKTTEYETILKKYVKSKQEYNDKYVNGCLTEEYVCWSIVQFVKENIRVPVSSEMYSCKYKTNGYNIPVGLKYYHYKNNCLIKKGVYSSVYTRLMNSNNDIIQDDLRRIVRKRKRSIFDMDKNK